MKKEEYLQLVRDFGSTFSTPEGLRVLEYLKDEIFDNLSFDITDTDPLKTAWREGQRHVIAEILWKIKQHNNPDILNQLFEDNDDNTSPYL